MDFAFYPLTFWSLPCWRHTHLNTQVTSPHRDMKMAKKTVAGLSKRCEALAVPQAVLSRQKSQAPSQRGHMVKLRLSSHISWLRRRH